LILRIKKGKEMINLINYIENNIMFIN
jgi:hypothetical protein